MTHIEGESALLEEERMLIKLCKKCTLLLLLISAFPHMKNKLKLGGPEIRLTLTRRIR